MDELAEGRAVTLITGASSGIGADLARVFARSGRELVLVARDVVRMDGLADEILAGGHSRPMVVGLDLTSPDAALRLAEGLKAAGVTVNCLVNNAGFGVLGPFAGADTSGQLGMMDLNMRVLVELTSLLMPQIQASKGKILNVASVAAFAAGPGLAIYYATKAFVVSFSDALNYELRVHGVTASALCPGATATGFQARAGFTPDLVLMKMGVATSMSVAQAGYDGLMAGKRRIVPGIGNKIMVGMLSLTPRSLSLPIIAFLQSARGPKIA